MTLSSPAPAHLTTAVTKGSVPPDDSTRRQASNAEVLLWQSKFRVGGAVLGAAIGVTLLFLRGRDWLPADSYSLGVAGSARALLGTIVVYLAVVAMVHVRATRAGSASAPTVAVVTAADLAFVFGAVYLTAPTAYYEGAVVATLVTSALTQVYFGRLAGAGSLAASVLGYALLVLAGIERPLPVEWGEHVWTLLMYVLAGSVLVIVQASHADRLAGLVALFERGEDGDFAKSYDADADTRPDTITAVGRAYNRMREQLSTIVLTDSLSGCANRRGFEEQLSRELARAVRARSELALVAIDVDYFKLINDTFGHLVGDMAIQEIGRLLKETARVTDVVARMGGEEFMILAPNTGAAGAFHLGNRVLEAFRKRSFEAVGGKIPVTVSVGVVADQPKDRHIGEDLRARADEALYAAKRGGRNRVVVWTPGVRAPASPGLSSGGQQRIDELVAAVRAGKR